MSIEESLKKKAKAECGLDLENIILIGTARHFFQTDPFDYGKGTDTPAFMFVADGKGELRLDGFHSSPLIVTREMYTAEFREKLHPYVKDFLDMAFFPPEINQS